MAIGETISSELWFGPGSSSFYAAATALQGVIKQIQGILDGQQANASALRTAWASPTGEKAVSANTPYQTWLTGTMTQVNMAVAQIQIAASSFDWAKTTTPTPLQFIVNNTEFALLTATNFLGQNTARIAANRAEYALYTGLAVGAMTEYTTMSVGTVQALAALPAPPLTAIPGSLAPSISAMPSVASAMPSVASAVPSVASALPSVGSVAGQPVSAVSQLLSQPSSALMSSGSELSQAPSSMASAPMSSMTSGLGSPTAGSGGLGGAGAGTDSGNLFGAMSAPGGAVTAAMSPFGGGGGGGLSGLGGAAALAPMRGPGSWASTVSAAPEADQAVVSRFAEARAVSATPATSSGMGAPGTMMPPGRQASAQERDGDGALATAATVLYRPPRDMPVVTGAAGAQVLAGEEDH